MPDEFHDPTDDARGALDHLGIEWRNEEVLHHWHALAKDSLYSAHRFLDLMRVVDVPGAVFEESIEVWLERLLSVAVEVALFPDSVPPGVSNFDDLGTIWDVYTDHQRQKALGFAQSSNDPWVVRQLVKAAWALTFAEVGTPCEIKSVAADSAHHAALRTGQEVWLAFKNYTDEAIEDPEKREALWDEFELRWCSSRVLKQMKRVRMWLPRELVAVKTRLREKTGRTVQAGMSATASAAATIGNIIIENRIVMPESRDQNHTVGHVQAQKAGGEGAGSAQKSQGPPTTQPQDRKKSKRRGRPVDTDVKADRKIAEAWESGGYRTKAELANSFGLDPRDVNKALDRHRKRQG